jgi:hypothetical protein
MWMTSPWYFIDAAEGARLARRLNVPYVPLPRVLVQRWDLASRLRVGGRLELDALAQIARHRDVPRTALLISSTFGAPSAPDTHGDALFASVEQLVGDADIALLLPLHPSIAFEPGGAVLALHDQRLLDVLGPAPEPSPTWPVAPSEEVSPAEPPPPWVDLARASRHDLIDAFERSWARTDALFGGLKDAAAFVVPPPHRLATHFCSTRCTRPRST